MNTTKIKAYAPVARREFIKAVTDKAHMLGLSDDEILSVDIQGDVAIIGGQAFPKKIVEQRKQLEDRIRKDGFDLVMRAMAYTWFNRFVAIRFMELHDYLDHGFRVLSNSGSSDVPEILEQAAHVDLPGLNQDEVVQLRLAGDKDEELYRLLLLAQCSALNKSMPFLFESIGGGTELLLPENLLHSGSVIRTLVETIPKEDWQNVEIIGWLYQFYISEKKDEVIGKVVKSEDIPAATQLFTPNWIVKYMVQNSLGRKWMMTYPESHLKNKMEFYVEPIEQDPEVQQQLDEITPKDLNPEEITLLDPACGSGHILVEAYDLFKEIYQERGYRVREIPRLILEKNLYGVDIDDRAAQLTGFCLLMKARKDDRRILTQDDLQMNVMSIQSSKGIDPDDVATALRVDRSTIAELVKLFEHGKTFGSLIQVPEWLREKLEGIGIAIDEGIYKLVSMSVSRQLKPIKEQAEILGRKYDCVVANPPYMGRRYYNTSLKSFVMENYKAARGDLYTSFMARNTLFACQGGYVAMITIPNWMFLSTYKDFRYWLFQEATVETFCHNGRGVFGSDFGSCAFTFRHQSVLDYKGHYKRLFEKQGSVTSNKELIERFSCATIFEASISDFQDVPDSPVAYWISDRIRNVFAISRAMGEMVDARQGLATADNNRFLRLWYEVDIAQIGFGMKSCNEAKLSRKKWFPFNKGGEFRKWYGNQDYVINWEHDGRELKDFRPRSVIRNPDYYFLEAVTWSDVTIAENAFRYVPPGFIHDSTGHSVFRVGKLRKTLLSFCNNKFASQLIKVLNPTVHFHIGYFNNFPYPSKLEKYDLSLINNLVDISRKDWDSFETSWGFQSFSWLSSPLKASTTKQSFQNWQDYCNVQNKRMQELETENNRIFIEAYDLKDELDPEVPEEQITLAHPDQEEDVRRLLSYFIGCLMGRYSLDEPGLVYAHSGNEDFEHSHYKRLSADDDGIIPVMDMGLFDDDASNCFMKFLKVIWGTETLNGNLQFIAETLKQKKNENPEGTIRRYFSTTFFKDHLKTYKKRPIYWLFSSGKQKAFTCLVYLHRYNESTLPRMRSAYVTPLQGKFNARLDYLQSEINQATTASAKKKPQKELGTIKKKQIELAKFDEELRHYADKRINLDLDEGVKVNYGKFGTLLAEKKAVTGKK